MEAESPGNVDISSGGLSYLAITPVDDHRAETLAALTPAMVSRSTDVVGRRVGAFVIDFVIAYLGSTIFLSAIRSSDDRPDALGFLSFFVVVVYKTVLETLMRGETPGKMLLKIVVIRESGEPPGFIAAFARNIFLIPGLLLLCIPSLLMAEFSQKRQRLGDIVARTLVVSNPKSPPVVTPGTFVTTKGQPQSVALQTTTAAVVPQELLLDTGRRSSMDLRALAIGGTIAAALYVAAVAFLVVQSLTGNSQGACCFPEVRSSSWIHGDAGIAFAVLLTILSLVVVPAVVGFVTQSFAWIPLFGGLTFALLIPAWILGASIAESFYEDSVTEDVSGASIFLLIGLFIVPAIAVIPAAMGTFAGGATRWSRNRRVKST